MPLFLKALQPSHQAGASDMLFIVARITDVLVRPSMLILVCSVVGLILTLRRRRTGPWFLMAGIGALAAFAVLPLSTWMLRPLEMRFPVPQPKKIDGIIVLGGAISVARSVDHGTPQLNAMAGRMTAFAALARRHREARLLFTGGSGDLFAQRHSEAEFARMLFEGLGLREVHYESRSRNTRENAQFSWRLMRPKPQETWLLVTSAADLPRAVGSFRAVGWPVLGYPADYHTLGSGFFPGVVTGLSDADWAVHEWIGLLVYRLRGWMPSLFPGPRP
jgi:uncharacterized SAM-binding protein YcdF (DUF218 family)